MEQKQIETKTKIELLAGLFGLDPKWAVAVAMTESSLGLHQLSPTGCKGIFQMSTIAMKDLLLTMQQNDDDLVDIMCGLAFLRLLLRRHGSIEQATKHFCDPQDRGFYWDRVRYYMKGVLE